MILPEKLKQCVKKIDVNEYFFYISIKMQNQINNKNTEEIFDFVNTLDNNAKNRFIKKIVQFNKLDLYLKLSSCIHFNVTQEDLLKCAAVENAEDMVHYFLENGINVTIDDNFVLRVMASKCSVKMLQTLIDYGADVHADNDYAVKSVALSSPTLEKIKILHRAGANIHVDDDCCLRIAAHFNKEPLMIYLIDNGANIHVDNEYVLVRCMVDNNVSVVEYLLNLNADMNCITLDNIIEAFYNQSFEALDFLIDSGLDFSIFNNEVGENNVVLKIIDRMIQAGLDPKIAALSFSYAP